MVWLPPSSCSLSTWFYKLNGQVKGFDQVGKCIRDPTHIVSIQGTHFTGHDVQEWAEACEIL